MARRAPTAPPARRQAGAGAPPRGDDAGDGGAHQFVARIRRVGTFLGVDVPAGVSRALGVRGHVFVVGTIDGAVPLRLSLSPCGGGRHLLFLKGALRREAGVEEGDRITVRLARDPDPRLPAPEDLAGVLRDAGAVEAFEALPVGRRNMLLRYLDEAVLPATREKRLARAVEEALAARERKLDRRQAGRA